MKNINLEAFFTHCRGSRVKPGVMGPTLDGNEVSGAETIIKAMNRLPISFVAYALATAWHETAHTMQPITEMGSKARAFRLYDIGGTRPTLARLMGNTTSGDGVKYIGRGFVQLTWKTNYEKAGNLVGESLVEKPELANRPDVAALVMKSGMTDGWFTGKKLADYLPTTNRPATAAQFKNARRIINGTDADELIAFYALAFQDALVAGDYRI